MQEGTQVLRLKAPTAEVPAPPSSAPPYACLPSAAAVRLVLLDRVRLVHHPAHKRTSRAGAAPARRGRGRRRRHAAEPAPPHRLDGGARQRASARPDPAHVLPPPAPVPSGNCVSVSSSSDRNRSRIAHAGSTASGPIASVAPRAITGISNGISWSAPRSDAPRPPGTRAPPPPPSLQLDRPRANASCAPTPSRVHRADEFTQLVDEVAAAARLEPRFEAHRAASVRSASKPASRSGVRDARRREELVAPPQAPAAHHRRRRLLGAGDARPLPEAEPSAAAPHPSCRCSRPSSRRAADGHPLRRRRPSRRERRPPRLARRRLGGGGGFGLAVGSERLALPSCDSKARASSSACARTEQTRRHCTSWRRRSARFASARGRRVAAAAPPRSSSDRAPCSRAATGPRPSPRRSQHLGRPSLSPP